MSGQRPLQGACSCGRNHYSIVVPTEATEQAEVYFDDSSESRRSQATPLTAWLRVPLSWVSSTTIAQFPDESHSSIRRIFTPIHTPHSKRIFCGYCGTHLSYWTEKPASEADYLNVTLGSLFGEGIRALQDLNLLSDDVDPEEVGSTSVTPNQESTSRSVATENGSSVIRSQHHGQSGDLTWFEEMIDGSRLGRTQKKRRGMGVSADGTTTVQWEVEEYGEGLDDESDRHGSRTKRKIADVGSGDDVPMKN